MMSIYVALVKILKREVAENSQDFTRTIFVTQLSLETRQTISVRTQEAARDDRNY